MEPYFDTSKSFHKQGFRGDVLDNVSPKRPRGRPYLKRPQNLESTPLNTPSEMIIDAKLIIFGYCAPSSIIRAIESRQITSCTFFNFNII